MRVAIIGAGELGKQFSHMIKTDTEDVVVGFFDDYAKNKFVHSSYPILGKLDEVVSCYSRNEFDKVFCAIGYNHLKFKNDFCEMLEESNIPFYRFIHSSAYIDPSAVIGEDCAIYPGAIIDKNVVLKKHSIINLGVVVSHDTEIEEACFLSPNVAVAGFCRIGKRCNIGISTSIIDNITICSDVQLGGGSLVIKNIEKSGLYIGSPVHKINNNDTL